MTHYDTLHISRVSFLLSLKCIKKSPITKSEFDSLKNNFHNQITNYNISIDNKIDGAIASYLAGINLTKYESFPFFDGLGKSVLITNSSNINDMVSGTIGLDVAWWLIYGTSAGSSEGAATTVNAYFKRDSKNDVEMLTVDEVSDSEYIFKGYSKTGNIFCTVNSLKVVLGSFGQYSNPSSINVAWHGGWTAGDSPAATLVKADWDDKNIPSTYKKDCVYYCQNLSSPQFFGASTSINCHWNRYYSDTNKWVTDGRNMIYDTAVDLSQNTILADYIMDSNISDQSAVWTLYKPTAYDIVTEIQGKYNSDAIESWDLPTTSGTGVSTDLAFYCDGKANKSKYVAGNWSKTSKNGDNSTRTAAKWYELTLRQRNLDMANIYNNVDQSIIAKYSPFGYTGKISEGLPIMISEKAGTLSFDINTTQLGKSVYIGFNANPINEKGVAFENMSRSSKISTIKIDGIEITGGSALITNGSHKFAIDVSEKDVPVFFKIAYPSSDTSTDRKFINLPNNFYFVAKD